MQIKLANCLVDTYNIELTCNSTCMHASVIRPALAATENHKPHEYSRKSYSVDVSSVPLASYIASQLPFSGKMTAPLGLPRLGDVMFDW